MKNFQKKKFLSSPMGYSFLLTIMVILMLVVFSVLSLSTSLRDYKYSQRMAEKTTAYYAANSKAYGIIEKIDGIITKSDDWESAWKEVSEETEVTVLTRDEMSATVYYEVEVTKQQKLQVMITINLEKDKKVSYQITEWKEVPSKEWNSDTKLPVIGSE